MDSKNVYISVVWRSKSKKAYAIVYGFIKTVTKSTNWKGESNTDLFFKTKYLFMCMLGGFAQNKTNIMRYRNFRYTLYLAVYTHYVL